MDFEPRFIGTAIGSLPHVDPRAACNLMVDSFPDAPPWPQLPARSYLENMYVQFCEGMPGVRIDEGARRMWVETGEDFIDELEVFYHAVEGKDIGRFRISGRFAAGLDVFLSTPFVNRLKGVPYLKGQITGPVSFGLTVADQNRHSILYDVTLEEVVVRTLSLKAAWQVQKLREAAPDAKVIMFFDEPYLVSVGSALMNVSREQVIRDIRGSMEECGADILGVHCCGNTDWSIVFEVEPDVINFDAWDYLEGFLAYHDHIAEHIGKGRSVAWGIVPNDERVLEVDAEQLVEVIEESIKILEDRGVDREALTAHSMITPACGLGSASVEVAEHSMALTAEVSRTLRERYFTADGE